MIDVVRMAGVGALLALAGCATLSETTEQVVSLQTILDNREVAGVGCVLSNAAGRWFVVSPGRVAIQKSAGVLTVDCVKGGAATGLEVIASRPNNTVLIGNAVTSAGIGYYLDRRTGAGFDYPAVLTVLMHQPEAAPEPESGAGSANVVY
ncbi:MAG: hypothetical protein V4508_24045 [Pseudomonadota bacterium]